MNKIIAALLLGAMPVIGSASGMADGRGSLSGAKTLAVGVLNSAIENIKSLPEVNRLQFIGYMHGYVDVLPHLIQVRETIKSADILTSWDSDCQDGGEHGSVYNGQGPIYICGKYLAEERSMDVAQTIIHEGFHAAGMREWADECAATDTSIYAMLYAGKAPNFSNYIESGECATFHDSLAEVFDRFGNREMLRIGSEFNLNLAVIPDVLVFKGHLQLTVMNTSGNLPAAGIARGKVVSISKGSFQNGVARTDFKLALAGGASIDLRISKVLLYPTTEDIEWLTNGNPE